MPRSYSPVASHTFDGRSRTYCERRQFGSLHGPSGGEPVCHTDYHSKDVPDDYPANNSQQRPNPPVGICNRKASEENDEQQQPRF